LLGGDQPFLFLCDRGAHDPLGFPIGKRKAKRPGVVDGQVGSSYH
jgi:hypothetical protein